MTYLRAATIDVCPEAVHCRLSRGIQYPNGVHYAPVLLLYYSLILYLRHAYVLV